MKHLVILTACLLYVQSAFTQVSSNKFTASLKGKYRLVSLQIQGGHSVSVEGYDGDDLIVEAMDITGAPRSQPQEAGGLKDVTALMNRKVKKVSMQPVKVWEMSEKDTITEKFTKSISWDRFPPDQDLLIKVPRSTNFSVYFSATSASSKISAKNLNGELNISGNASLIDVSHVSGPLVLRSSGTNSSGKVTVSDIDWQKQAKQKHSISISCAQQDIDVSIPANVGAKVAVGSTHGAFYTDLIPATQDAKPVANHNFTWTINGGGIPIYLTTTYGNIYLRKQK